MSSTNEDIRINPLLRATFLVDYLLQNVEKRYNKKNIVIGGWGSWSGGGREDFNLFSDLELCNL